jgi:hypothetical protein
MDAARESVPAPAPAPARARERAGARARGLGVPFDGTPAPLNAITDVLGVEVGHVTLISGEGRLEVGRGPVRTGVTAVLPRGRASLDPVFAAWFSLNGNGEMTGTAWIDESGFLEGPVLITNTHSVGVVRDAVVAWLVARNPRQRWALPVVAIPRYPGNATALGVSARPYRDFSALMTGINPVPGPRMGEENFLYLRYHLRGGSEATFQHFSLSTNDNNHIRVEGLTEGKWSEVTLSFSRDARRNDGTPGVPFAKGKRMDDFKVFVGKPGDGKPHDLVIDDIFFFPHGERADLLLDEVVLFDAAPPGGEGERAKDARGTAPPARGAAPREPLRRVVDLDAGETRRPAYSLGAERTSTCTFAPPNPAWTGTGTGALPFQ